MAEAVAATEVPPAPPLPVVRDQVEPPSFAIPPVPQVTGRNQAETLTAATVLRSRKARPQSGWRKTVLHVTGGRINFGPSPADRRRADLVSRARTPVVGCHRVASSVSRVASARRRRRPHSARCSRTCVATA